MAKNNKFAGILQGVISKQEDGQKDIQAKMIVLDELKKLIPPLHEKEFEQLEKNILEEGILETIKVWKDDDKYVLIDGHNRFDIATKHDIPFKVDVLEFDDLSSVKKWMIHFQLGRRNLSSQQMAYLRGFLYNQLKLDSLQNIQKPHLNEIEPRGQIVHSREKDKKTADLLSDEYNVSEKTVRRDGLFAEGLDKLEDDLKADVLMGNIKPRKADIEKLATLELADKIDTLDKIEELIQAKPKKINPFKKIVTQTQDQVFIVITGSWLLTYKLEHLWAEKREIDIWKIDENFEDRISLKEAIKLGVLTL